MDDIYENRDAILLQRKSLAPSDGSDFPVQENYESLTSSDVDQSNDYGFPSASLPSGNMKKLDEVPYEDDLYREMYLSVGVSEGGDEGSVKTVSDDQEVYDDIKSNDKAEIIKTSVRKPKKVSVLGMSSLGISDTKKQTNGPEPDNLFKTIQRQPMLSLTSEKSIETYRKIHKAQMNPEYPRYCVALIVFNFIFNIFVAIAVVMHILHVFPPQSHTHKEVNAELNHLRSEIVSLKTNLSFAASRQQTMQRSLNTITACPSGWHLFNSSCYLLVRKHKLAFLDAEKSCMHVNASVTSIHSMEENDFIVSHFMKCPWSSTDPLYIGLSYDKFSKETSFSFRWRDNSTLDYLATSKRNNIPQDRKCVTINSNGVWNNVKCSGRLNYVCRGVATHVKPCPLG